MTTPTLASKAMLVKLTAHKAGLTRRDDDKTDQLQQTDKAALGYVQLFKFKTPVHELTSLHRAVGQLHRRLTLPYEDRGARLLPNTQYFAYTAAMREAMGAVTNWFDQHRVHYATYVGADCAARGWTVQPDQYPTIDEFEEAFSFDLDFTPLPQLSHFLFDLSPADCAAFEARQTAVAEAAVTDALDRVRKPIDVLLTRLQTYTGQPGQKFVTSLLTNVADGITDMEKLLLQDVPPSFRATLDQLRTTMTAFAVDADALRESQWQRDQLIDQLTTATEALSTATTPTADAVGIDEIEGIAV
jgi:hypothetical protein